MSFIYKIVIVLILLVGISSTSQAQCQNGICFTQPSVVQPQLMVSQYGFGSYYYTNNSLGVPFYNYSYYNTFNYRVVQPVYVPQVYCVRGRCYQR